MEAAGFLVPGISEWGAYSQYPLKKNGDHRFVCNYIPINSCTVKPQWPVHARDKFFLDSPASLPPLRSSPASLPPYRAPPALLPPCRASPVLLPSLRALQLYGIRRRERVTSAETWASRCSRSLQGHFGPLVRGCHTKTAALTKLSKFNCILALQNSLSQKDTNTTKT